MNKELQLSSVLSKARSLLSSSNDSIDTSIQKRNAELQNLLDKYKEKFAYDETSAKVSYLEEESKHKDDKLTHVLALTSKERSLLESREHSFHEKLAEFEQEKALLESKRYIVMNEISKVDDPKLKHSLKFIENRFEALSEKESELKDLRQDLAFKEQSLLSKENKLYHASVKKQQELQRYEQSLLNLQTQQEDLELVIKGLKQKKIDTELLIRERSDLVQDLNKQFSDSKLQLRRIMDQSEKEQQLLARTREEIQTEKRSLRQERSNFDSEKEAFYAKMRSISDESKREVDSYRSKVLTDVKTQINLADEKLDSLRARESMLQKLETELRQREHKISEELDKVARNSSVSQKAKDEFTKKLQEVETQKSELQDYESEVTQLEQTVLDLKAVVESKEKELSQRLSALESKETLVEKKSRELHEKFSQFKSLSDDAGFDVKFKDLFKESKLSLDSGDLMQAQSSYTKACKYYSHLDQSLKAAYSIPLRNLYSRIKSAIN